MNRRLFIALLAGSSAAGGAVRLAAQSKNEVEIMAMKFSFRSKLNSAVSGLG